MATKASRSKERIATEEIFLVIRNSFRELKVFPTYSSTLTKSIEPEAEHQCRLRVQTQKA
jgi:hypothetical protein